MGESKSVSLLQLLLIWLLAMAVSLVFFYGLDHLSMNMQGLPLNWDLTPAQ